MSSEPHSVSTPDAGAPPSARAEVTVVGGGLLGSVLALRLRREGHDVVLLEAAPELGGMAASDRSAGFIRDRFYHVVLMSDLNTRRLIDELGLGDTLHWGTTRTGFFSDGRLHSMANAIEFLRFRPLGLIDKFRLAATITAASRIRDPGPLERVTAVDWLRRLSGRRVVDRIWLPLLRSKLGENTGIASAAFIWAIIARMYAARRSGLKQEMFGYLDGGYAGVLDALSARLREAGVRVHTGFRVQSIERLDDAGLVVRAADGRTIRSDRVISTVSPRILLRTAPGLSAAERERLGSIRMQGVVCVAVLTKQPLSPYYVTNITDPGLPFTGVIEYTALADRAQFGGHSLVYLPFYLPQDDGRWTHDDAAFREAALSGLQTMYTAFRRDDVVDVSVARSRDVLAISTLDYSGRSKPALRTSVPGLLNVTSAQIAYGTLNVNETLGLIDEQWDAIRDALPRPSAAQSSPAAPASASSSAPARAAASSDPSSPASAA